MKNELLGSAAMLLPIIQNDILPGTTIYSDEWRAYTGTTTIPAGTNHTHHTANHSQNIVDSITEQKKRKQERIEEKKAVRGQQEVANAASTTGPPLTAEEQIEEKLRLQKVQQEADLEVTKELFGGKLE
jgi:hypothetical protein